MCANVEDIVKDVEIQVVGDRYLFSGRLQWEVNVCQTEAPHQMGREVDRMGQAVKRQVYRAVLQQVDEEIAGQWQLANPQWQKRGGRPYTFITPFGRVTMQRRRLMNAADGSWQVPSHKVWQTPHRQCIVQGLREETCDRLRDLSVRETRDSLAKEADTEQLLANATVVKILHQEGSRLVSAQRERAEETLRQHPSALAQGLATLAPADEREGDADSEANVEPASAWCEEEVALSPEEEQQVWQRAVGFMKPPEEHSVCTQGVETAVAGQEQPGPRKADADAVVVQVDEVKTKAQACCEGKENWTYTGYVQAGERRSYLVEASADELWRVLTALLCTLGVLQGAKRLLLIADGARWIGNWFADVKLPGKEMILCWFHLAKKVYEQLSGAGLGKERRATVEHEVLHSLWQGELAKALWLLWGAREQARSPQKITELIRYLLRRRDQLPNYAARHEAGLMITSNRVEKWNDWAVSERCKRRGMSWTPNGVLCLAAFEAARRNQELDTWRQDGELPAHEHNDASTSYAQSA
jgi:hypothetical protein